MGIHAGRQGGDFIEDLRAQGHDIPTVTSTPYINTIPPDRQPAYPGDLDMERKIKSYIRWNAMAMVVKANAKTNVGGHISTFASSATLYEVGQNHFFRGGDGGRTSDFVYFQGHASPGPYARSFLEGRISEKLLHNFRQELAEGVRGQVPDLATDAAALAGFADQTGLGWRRLQRHQPVPRCGAHLHPQPAAGAEQLHRRDARPAAGGAERGRR